MRNVVSILKTKIFPKQNGAIDIEKENHLLEKSEITINGTMNLSDERISDNRLSSNDHITNPIPIRTNLSEISRTMDLNNELISHNGLSDVINMSIQTDSTFESTERTMSLNNEQMSNIKLDINDTTNSSLQYHSDIINPVKKTSNISIQVDSENTTKKVLNLSKFKNLVTKTRKTVFNRLNILHGRNSSKTSTLMLHRCIDCDQCLRDYLPCQPCIRGRYQNEYKNWSSGNIIIDKLVKYVRLSPVNTNLFLEWIPYEDLEIVNTNFAMGSFGTISLATWLNGYIIRWSHNKKLWHRKGKMQVVLKTIKSDNISDDFITEVYFILVILTFR
jgi:hypothetical protein